jgi:signal transduction histidine kinase
LSLPYPPLDPMIFEDASAPSSLRPQELEAVYAISSAVAQSIDFDNALDEIIKLARPVFIFDNMVLYTLSEGKELEPRYARVIGRGRSAEGEIAWGGFIASQVFQTGEVQEQLEKLDDWENNRLNYRLLLGLPLRSADGMIGTVVFGRFGGPAYTPDQVNLAGFIAAHTSQLLVRQHLVERIANLEAVRRLQQMQENFIATISHEICTPLGFIKGYATTLLREDTDWDEATRKEFLTIIDEETDRLRELIDNMLDSSRLQTGTLQMRFQQIHLNELLAEVCARVSSRYRGLVLHCDPCERVIIQVDPLRVVQVLDNLINNAVKYAPDSPIFVSLQSTDRKCEITIRDRGPGISPEHLEHLFERFYRVPESINKAHGTGLGLYICREIVVAHGGEITVESELGEGTAFHIYLPIGTIEDRPGQ